MSAAGTVTACSLGAAATKGVSTSVTSGDANLVTGDAVYKAINIANGGKKIYTEDLDLLYTLNDVDSEWGTIGSISINHDFEVLIAGPYGSHFVSSVKKGTYMGLGWSEYVAFAVASVDSYLYTIWIGGSGFQVGYNKSSNMSSGLSKSFTRLTSSSDISEYSYIIYI